MTTVVFLGPSLPKREAAKIIDAIYLPPVAQGDVVSAISQYNPSRISIIDGVFLQEMAVWHKEILFGISLGIKMYGASSMGALRAVETAAFGMRGVGTIYSKYASGELTDDDEVALIHGPVDTGYRPVTEPMVNIRATFAAAEVNGLITMEQAEHLTKIAKALQFGERTFDNIFSDGTLKAWPPRTCEAIRQFTREGYVDLKREDAIALLTVLRNEVNEEPAQSKCTKTTSEHRWKFNRSTLFDNLYNRDRQVMRGDISIRLSDIADHIILHHPEFARHNHNALNREIVLNFAAILKLSASKEEIDVEGRAFWAQNNIQSAGEQMQWAQENNMDPTDVEDMISQRAITTKLHKWLLLQKPFDRNIKGLLNEMRVIGEYEKYADEAALFSYLFGHAAPREGGLDLTAGTIKALLSEHVKETGLCVDRDVEEWSVLAGFRTIADLQLALTRAKKAREFLGKIRSAFENQEPKEDGENRDSCTAPLDHG